ncbi:MAG: hypothetical protein ACOY33_05310 [Pseudomonadota bacterium]
MSSPVWSRLALLAASLLLAGCTSLGNPVVRGDLFETRARGSEALDGNEAAFDRLEQLQRRWAARGEQGWCYRLMPWDHANRARAGTLANEVERVTLAREAVLSQRELSDVMTNALRDLEDEYDAIAESMQEEESVSAADLRLIAEQKYLARRMAGSLVLMSTADMSHAAEAADLFGRDVSRFQQLLSASLNGSEELGVEPPANADIEESLAQIDELFNDYVVDSVSDVLDNVVARYDAWLALGELARLTPAGRVTAREAAPADDGESAADDGAAGVPAGEEDIDAGVADENAGAEAFRGEEEPQDDAAPEDELPPEDEEPADADADGESTLI